MKVRLVIGIALVALIGVVFGQVGDFAFINFDDSAYVFANPNLRQGMSAAGLRYAFTTTTMGNYNPLVWLTFFVDYERAGLDPGAYHVTNVVLHAGNALLLFWLFVRLTGHVWPSAFVAAVFALHPAHVESVAWVSSRKDVLSTFFWFATLFAYGGYARKPTVKRYLLVTVLFSLGLLSKPMLVTVPCVLLLLDVWPLGRAELRWSEARSWGRLVVEKVPLFALSIAASARTVYAQHASGAIPPGDQLGLATRLPNALVGYLRYLGKAVWPTDLIPFYPYPSGGYGFPAVAFAVSVLIGSSWVCWYFRRRFPYALVGWLWFLGTFVPVIGFVQVGGQAIADRYTYVPFVGLTIVVAWAARDMARAVPGIRYGIGPAAILLVAVCTWLAHEQTARWRNTPTLFEYTLSVSPENPVALGSMGEYYLSEERWVDGVAMLERAAKADPQRASVLRNLGKAYRHLGRFAESRTALERARDLDAESPKTLIQLAILAQVTGDRAAMRQHLEHILAVDPRHVGGNVNMGNWYLTAGRVEEAERHYRIALESVPDQPEALSNLGAIALVRHEPDQAIELLTLSLETDPDDVVTLTNLGVAHLQKGDTDEALEWAERALAVNPDYVKAQALKAQARAAGKPVSP